MKTPCPHFVKSCTICNQPEQPKAVTARDQLIQRMYLGLQAQESETSPDAEPMLGTFLDNGLIIQGYIDLGQLADFILYGEPK